MIKLYNSAIRIDLSDFTNIMKIFRINVGTLNLLPLPTVHAIEPLPTAIKPE